MALARKSRTSPIPVRFFLVVAAVLLLATACGGGDGESTSAGVASLEDVAVAADVEQDDANEESGEQSADEAALVFSACMRDQGLDFPDIGLDSDGNPDLGSALDDVDRNADDFRTAIQECRPLLEGAGFGGGGRAAIADNVDVQDALVAFSDCVRDDGWDVGDLELGGRGQGQGQAADQAAGEAPAEGQGGRNNEAGGQRGEGFGDPTARFARGLGLDPEDPAVIETMETCSPIIEEAFADAGAGQGRN